MSATDSQNALHSRTLNAIGGVNTHIIMELLPMSGSSTSKNTAKYAYIGNMITASYSVYREKTPVFNCGATLIDGYAMGKKYVAGSLISIEGSMRGFIEGLDKAKADSFSLLGLTDSHTIMMDDIGEVNIHIIFSDEVTGKHTRVIIYQATMVNNGQVVSVNDLLSEDTVSFIARDIRELHPLSDDFSGTSRSVAQKASNIQSLPTKQLYAVSSDIFRGFA